jgi:hypothetical protein
MTTRIRLTGSQSGFAEDKAAAKELRIQKILPALERNEDVVLDFGQITYATQSYIHALIGEALKRFRDEALERLEFKNCSPQLQSLIELVVDYSLGGFPAEVPSDKPLEKDAR